LLSSGGPPAGKAQPAAGSRRGQQIAEGRDRIGKEHDAEVRGDQVEPVGLEMVDLRIGPQQRDIAEPAISDAVAGACQHRLGDVDPDDPTALADGLGEQHRGGAGAAADLDHAFARRDH
jgi:hypothetical protein